MSRKHNQKREAGIVLVEALIYIVICVMIAGMLTRFFLQGMHASSVARKVLLVNQEAEILLQALRNDFKQVRSVLLPNLAPKSAGANWPEGARVALSMTDGQRIFYTCGDGAIYRSVSMPGHAARQSKTLGQQVFAGKFASLRIALMPGTSSVYRIDLAMPLNTDILRPRRPRKPQLARYTTAVQVRSEEDS